jgi:hypothetical protein
MKLGMKRILLGLATSLLFMGCMDQNQNVSAVKADPSNFSVSGLTANPQRAAEVLGLASNPAAPSGNCARCHGDFKTFDGLNNLYDSTYYAYQCLKGDTTTDASKSAALACLAKLNNSLTNADLANIDRGDVAAISKGVSTLKPSALGFFTAATSLEPFQRLFTGNSNRFASILAGSWVRSVAMPKGGAALSQADFQTGLTWLMRETPNKEKFLTHNGPNVCSASSQTFIGAGVKAHVSRMSEEGEGWNFKNQANGLKMFACEGDCFANKVAGKDVFPIVPNVLAGAGEVRRLHAITDDSTFWTRSSADGRYVSYGAKPDSIIIDLQPKLAGKAARKITVEADYDPAFTPDNLSFMYQGEEHGTRFCNQSMLANAATTHIDFNNSNCTSSSLRIGLYQAIGSSLENGDIMAIAGGFKSDEGSTLVQDVIPVFSGEATIDISRIRQSETGVFQKVNVTRVATPYIANWTLSPSDKLAIGTVSAATADKKARHGGYRIVRTDAPSIATGSLPSSLSDTNTAMLCVGAGEKPQVSFDERYVVYYSYEKHADLVKAAQSSSNLYVIDLLGDGKPVQLTNLPKGQFAQFPHFRSDGWLYFDLYNSSTGVREIVATDAVLQLQK